MGHKKRFVRPTVKSVRDAYHEGKKIGYEEGLKKGREELQLELRKLLGIEVKDNKFYA